MVLLRSTSIQNFAQATEAINEHKDEPFLAVERAVRQAVKERAMYKIKLFGDDGRADE